MIQTNCEALDVAYPMFGLLRLELFHCRLPIRAVFTRLPSVSTISMG